MDKEERAKKEKEEKIEKIKSNIKEIKAALPKRLEELRKKDGLTLIELGQELPLPKSTIFRYETSETVPPIEVLALYGEHFGITIQELVFGKAEKNSEVVDALYPIIKKASVQSVHTMCGLLEIVEDYINGLMKEQGNSGFMAGKNRTVDYKITATTLGGRLRELRKSMGYSQADMEACIGLSEKTFSKFERGLATPPLEVFVFYAKFCGITIDHLYFGNYPKISEQFRLLTGCLARVSCDFHSLAKKMFMFASEQNLFETWLD